MTVKIDESQEGIKVWTERNLLSQTTLIKCSASRTVGEVLARMREHSVEETKRYLEQVKSLRGPAGRYCKMEVVGLAFEGEPLSEADTLEKCGISDGTNMSAIANMEASRANVCCIEAGVPAGAYYLDGSLNIQYKQPAAGGAAVAPEGPILMER